MSDFGNTEEIARFRKLNRIRVYGSDIPAPIKSFQHLAHRYSVDAALTKTLQERGYAAPTPIQMQTLPIILDVFDLQSRGH